jgi:hypothetical protein
MKAFCVRSLLMVIALLGSHMNGSASCDVLCPISGARCESNWMIEEGWKHSHLKCLDIMAAARAARDQGSNDGEATDNAVKKLLAHFRALNADRAPALIVEPAIWFFDPDSPVHKMNFDWLQTSIDNLLEVVNPIGGSTAKWTFRNGCLEPYGRDRAIRGFPDIDGWIGVDALPRFFR